VTGDHAASGSFDILALEGVADIEHSEVVCSELLRVEQDADLAGLAAVQRDAADAVYGLDGAADLLIGNFGQLAAADGTADEQRQDRVRLRVLFGDDGWQCIAWKPTDGGGHFFANVLRGAVNVALENEGASNVGEAFAGVDGDFVNAADRRDCVFERENDARDDFFGRGAGQLDINVDGGGIGFGKKIHSEAAVGKRAKRDEKRDQHHGEDGILDASFG
jgi:hypothetical protein